MKTLDFTKLEFKKDIVDQFKAGNTYSPQKVLKNMFNLACNTKFKNGASLETQRLFAKVCDRLEAGADAVNENGIMELSDEHFQFLYDVLTGTEVPLFTGMPTIADFLEEIKIKKA